MVAMPVRLRVPCVRRAPTCSWASRTPPAQHLDRDRRSGSASASRRDDVRRRRRGDLAGSRTADPVGDEHAGGAEEPGVLVAAAHQARVAHGDTGEPQHPAHPFTVSNDLPTISRFRAHRVGHRPVAVRRARSTRHNGRMEWLLLGISVGLVLACGVFGAAEYSLRRGRPRRRREGRRPRATARPQGVRRALRTPLHPALRRPDRRHPDQPGDRLPRRARDRERCSRHR